MNEDFYVRCSRCDAIVALQDSTSCGFHHTSVLCQHCWKHHWATYKHAAEALHVPGPNCWAEDVLQLFGDVGRRV